MYPLGVDDALEVGAEEGRPEMKGGTGPGLPPHLYGRAGLCWA